jgi:hypothetical protein
MKTININQGDEFKDLLERLNYLQKILEQSDFDLEDNETMFERFELVENHFEKICYSFEKRVASRIDEIKITSLKTELHKLGRISQGKVTRADEALDMVTDVINSIFDFQKYLVDPFNFSSAGLRKLDIRPQDNATMITYNPDEPFNIQPLFTPVKEHPKMKNVFISYNHKDVDFAEKLHEDLKKNNIQVIRDKSKMLGGKSIEGFIKESVQNTDKTIFIVSENSLLSAWVGTEIVRSLFLEEQFKTKLIACAINQDFFEEDYLDKLVKILVEKIEKKKVQIISRLEGNIGQEDLSGELSRLNDLRHNLPKIFRRLKEHLTLDFGEEQYEESLEKLLKSI